MTLLRGQPEPIPPRREQIQATRVQLMMRGIPHAAFYEVVDFAPELGQFQRDLLEAQLADAGILDALVVPRENLEEIRELLQEYPDRFLSPDPPVRDPIASLLPDGEPRFRETVLSCLRGISQSDLQAGTALLPDGRYRCGTIQGLQEEREQLPPATELDQALEILAQAQESFSAAQAKKERCLDQERAAKQAVARVEQQIREGSRGLPYLRAEEAYEEALDAAESYQALLGALGVSYSDWIHTADAVEAAGDRIAELRDQADVQNRSAAQTQKQLELSRARVQAIPGDGGPAAADERGGKALCRPGGRTARQRGAAPAAK